jgi:hypothetical protein
VAIKTSGPTIKCGYESGSVGLGAWIVAMHDEMGFPAELSFEMSREKEMRPAFLGCLLEASARNLPPRFIKEISGYFLANFTPTLGESLALAAWTSTPRFPKDQSTRHIDNAE